MYMLWMDIFLSYFGKNYFFWKVKINFLWLMTCSFIVPPVDRYTNENIT